MNDRTQVKTRIVGREDRGPTRRDKGYAAINLLETLQANVDNPKISDANFRDIVRRSLPVVLD